MKHVRFSIGNEVSICFTIEAEDEDAAIIKAQKFVDSIDSVPLDIGRDDCEDENKDVMFYTSPRDVHKHTRELGREREAQCSSV